MDIFDFHVHLPVKGFDPQFASFFKRYAQERGTDRLAKVRSWSAEYDRMWRRHWGFPEPEPALPAAEAAARWYREIKSAGLSGAVIATGGGNRILAKAIEPYRERLTGFAHHRPADPDAADELKTAVMELGFKGYKVFAPLVEIPLADRSLTALWEVAGEHRLPVLVHFGILGGGGGIASGTNINPLSLEPVARNFPEIRFVVPHFGCGYVRELLQLCWACANVYVDTSGNNEWLNWYPDKLFLEDLFRRFYDTVGPERIIFGSDSSWFPRGFARPYLEEQLRICRRLRFPDHHIQLIFGGNARRLLAEVTT